MNARKTHKRLYHSWKVLRQNNKGNIEAVWDSFETFVEDVGVKPSDSHVMDRKDRSLPWGPTNFKWRELNKIPGQKFNLQDYLKVYRPKYDRKRRYMQKYGITLEQYSQMLESQKGECAICECHESQSMQGIVRQLAVDHDHVTGKVRALLDNKCNAILGHSNDSVLLLTKCIAYLAEHSDNPQAKLMECVDYLRDEFFMYNIDFNCGVCKVNDGWVKRFKDNVWASINPEGLNFMCYDCAEKRLGRPLREDDFTT